MSRPFITALIDTYNQKLFIADAIHSVLEQDFPSCETEILVVDDGSTDGTSEVVEKFRPRVRRLAKINGGQASAFNAGIQEARGEVVAFLDGDDWWEQGKLNAIASIFESEQEVGLVGHGITIVDPNLRQVVQLPLTNLRFRVNSISGAKVLRMHRGFLGTSRMAYRRKTLDQIGSVPESLTFEADEYLFTLAGLYADVLILQKSFTFYRLHEHNLYQISRAAADRVKSKQEVVAGLARALRERFAKLGVPRDITNAALECVEIEADHLHLMVNNGFPWDTVRTELRIMRLFHSDASIWQRAFTYARLIPALIMPARSYYRWRQHLTESSFYRRLRKEFFPFPTPSHASLEERTK